MPRDLNVESLWARRPGVDRKQHKSRQVSSYGCTKGSTTLVACSPWLFGGSARAMRSARARRPAPWRRDCDASWRGAGTWTGSVGRWPPSPPPAGAEHGLQKPQTITYRTTRDLVLLLYGIPCLYHAPSRGDVASLVDLSRASDRHLVIDLVATWPLSQA